jgi:hypothetical protein
MQIPATKVLCALALTVLVTGCGLAQSQDDSSNDAHFEALGRCLVAVENEVDRSLTNPPRFDRIRDAVTWARTNLRGELGAAFAKAGVTVRERMSNRDLEGTVSDRDAFERDLYSAITAELQKFNRCEDGTAIAVVDKLNDVLYLRLSLGEGAMGKQFAQMGIGDSYDVKGAFLLMMALDGAGLRWDPAIFSQRSAHGSA